VLLEIKTPWNDGTTHLKLSPTELIARLAALVCRPRANQVLHLGVLSPHHRWRRRVTSEPKETDGVPSCSDPQPSRALAVRASAPLNYGWAELMQRGLQIDTLTCATCGGRFEHIANIMTRDVIRRILRHLGLRAEPPDLEPPRLPDQQDLFA
jgi:hypothetical protein